MKTFVGASLASHTGVEQYGARRPVRVLPRLAGMVMAAGLSVAATPSLAQSYDPDIGTGNIVPYYGQQSNPMMARNVSSAYARVSPGAARGGRRLAPAALNANASVGNMGDPGNPVVTDPDPNIRFQLNRESLQGRW
jgi:hypothetical protein